MTGTDVAALQQNLKTFGLVEVDGAFGPKTERAVKALQRTAKIEVDGIAGVATQGALVKIRARESEQEFELPDRLLESLAMSESGCIIPTFTWHPSDAGFDLGAFQRSITPEDLGCQGCYRDAYDVKQQAKLAGARIAEKAAHFAGAKSSRYSNALPGPKKVFPLQLAVLDHNFPYAAQNIATHGVVYPHARGKDNQPAEWVQQASGGRLQTVREWCLAYVERATALVDW